MSQDVHTWTDLERLTLYSCVFVLLDYREHSLLVSSMLRGIVIKLQQQFVFHWRKWRFAFS